MFRGSSKTAIVRDKLNIRGLYGIIQICYLKIIAMKD